MAKRIIENGKYNVVTCDECGCKFAFDKVDIEYDAEEVAFVTCPQCGATKAPEIKEQ